LLAEFMVHYWWVVLAAIVIVSLIVKLVKTFVKWVVILAIIAGVMVYGFNYTPDDLKGIGSKAVAVAKDATGYLMTSDISKMQYKDMGNGTYAITGDTVSVEGKTGEEKVKVTVHGKTFEVNASEVADFVQKVQAQNK
jgi:membrane protein implicated in regulation of membrane protease activity